MEKYLGVKMIKAEKQVDPKTLPGNNGQVGYKVVYEDGYESWSPKDVFEKAYRKINELTFGLAIEALKQGKSVTRKGWNNPEIWLELQVPDENSKMTESYMYMRKYDKKFPVEVSCESMLAEDWYIL